MKKEKIRIKVTYNHNPEATANIRNQGNEKKKESNKINKAQDI